MPASALIVDGLTLRYPGRPVPAVDAACWRADSGQLTALLGPNGAGKTSTIECCVGLRPYQAGRLIALEREGRQLLTPAHRAEVGVMLQDGGLPTGVKPMALLRHLARFYARPCDVEALAERLGIDGFAGTGIRRLSGGQRQRLALAAALVGRPRLLFLDEPTAGLDTEARLVVRELLREQCAAGVSVVLTTHDLDEAARVADKVVVMSAGQVVADDTPAGLTANLPRTLTVTLPPDADASGLLAAVPELRLEGPGRFHAAGPQVGPAQLAAAGAWCDVMGLLGVDLQLSPPSLEDVVISLTTHTPRAASRLSP